MRPDQPDICLGSDITHEGCHRPEDSMGSDEDWEMATEGLRSALEELGLPYVVNEGDGAFLCKIDFHLEDSIGRTWRVWYHPANPASTAV